MNHGDLVVQPVLNAIVCDTDHRKCEPIRETKIFAFALNFRVLSTEQITYRAVLSRQACLRYLQ
jgi:hypothetical protein